MASYLHLGIYLRRKRIERDLTQAELAQIAEPNMHPQFVSNWERGLCAPPNHCFQRIIDILRLDKVELASAMLSDAKVEIETVISKQRFKRRPS